MYHRYTSRNEGMHTAGMPRLVERIRTVVIYVLILACVLLGFFGGKAMRYQAESRDTFIARMQTECSDALSLTASLSRTAGANSSATLGRIRSHLYAMDTLNQLSAGLDGGYLISVEEFTTLYAVLDDYSDKLITGMQTGDLQTTLTNQLNSLSVTVGALR